MRHRGDLPYKLGWARPRAKQIVANQPRLRSPFEGVQFFDNGGGKRRLTSVGTEYWIIELLYRALIEQATANAVLIIVGLFARGKLLQ